MISVELARFHDNGNFDILNVTVFGNEVYTDNPDYVSPERYPVPSMALAGFGMMLTRLSCEGWQARPEEYPEQEPDFEGWFAVEPLTK